MTEIPSENILLAGSFLGFLVCFMFIVCRKAKPKNLEGINETNVQEKTTPDSNTTSPDKTTSNDEISPQKLSASDSSKIDNLKIVEGIGPKIESLLHAAGITSMLSLANSETGVIREVLDAAGPRFKMHNPETWSNQAKLISDENWDELKKYQDELKGGRDS